MRNEKVLPLRRKQKREKSLDRIYRMNRIFLPFLKKGKKFYPSLREKIGIEKRIT